VAQLFPDDFQLVDSEIIHRSEFDTLLRLKEGLSDQFMVFHGVHWTRVEEDVAIYGEIDFLILNPYGRVLAIEQKETQIEANNKGELVAIYKNQGYTKKNQRTINSQVSRNIGSLRTEYSKRYPDQRLEIDHLLYIPNATVTKNLPANIALGRIVDFSEKENLIVIINEIFDKNPMVLGDHIPQTIDILTFFQDKASITPQIGLIGHSAKLRTTRLASGLAQWAERLDFSPFRLWVQGTAGSGKTQLALQELRRAANLKLRSMYICFNRALVDSVKLSAPNKKSCLTFHELAKFIAEGKGHHIDFSKEGVYQWLENFLLSNYEDLKEYFDVLIIDEGQDFHPEWGIALLEMVKVDGRAIWLEDSSQRIYNRPLIEPHGWVKISSPTNYRSPQHILTLINSLNLTEDILETGNAYTGLTPGHFVYETGAEIQATKEAVIDLIEQGFLPESIAVLSFHGLKNSVLFSNDVEKINDFKVKKFIGYDNQSNALWSDGNLLVDSLFRFKGQCADAVVLTEIDFKEWDQVTKNKLFVGLTRARLTINLVMSTGVEKLFSDKGFS